MKTIKRCAVLLCLAVCCLVLLAACGGNTAAKTGSAASDSGELTFVGADKTNWDKALGIGDYAYRIALVLHEDGTAELTATCAGSGPSGEPEEGVDYSARDFVKSGSWTAEPGYGYTVTVDGYTTKTNYDKASARQILYIEIENGGESSGLVQLQAKDTAFRNDMAADYEEFEVRDAQYVFAASGTTGNGNASQTRIFLEKDGSANAKVQMGSSLTYTRGTWSENADKTLSITLGANAYTADYCDIAGKEGYRLVYSGSTMFASASGAEIAYTDTDFDGETIRTLSCGQRDYTVELTEKGTANVYASSGTKAASGRYTEEGGVLTVTIDGETYTSDDEGNITVSFTVISGGGPFMRSTTVERTFPVDGSLPPEIASGEASGEAAASEEPASDEAATEEPASEEPAPAE